MSSGRMLQEMVKSQQRKEDGTRLRTGNSLEHVQLEFGALASHGISSSPFDGFGPHIDIGSGLHGAQHPVCCSMHLLSHFEQEFITYVCHNL